MNEDCQIHCRETDLSIFSGKKVWFFKNNKSPYTTIDLDLNCFYDFEETLKINDKKYII